MPGGRYSSGGNFFTSSAIASRLQVSHPAHKSSMTPFTSSSSVCTTRALRSILPGMTQHQLPRQAGRDNTKWHLVHRRRRGLLTRKPLYPQGYRGFESHPLLQLSNLPSGEPLDGFAPFLIA